MWCWMAVYGRDGSAVTANKDKNNALQKNKEVAWNEK